MANSKEERDKSYKSLNCKENEEEKRIREKKERIGNF